ncbi:fiber protein [Synechococcus phage Ssp-JY42]|nr:hypothetical protein [Synechococcus phage Yong-M4-211]
MTTVPTITPLTTPVPTTDDPTNFQSRADVLVSELPTMVTQQNLAITAMNTVAGEVAASASAVAASEIAAEAAAAAAASTSSYFATSTTSLSVGSGVKAFTLAQTGKAFANGDDVTAFSRSNVGNRIRGPASSVNSGTGAITITVPADGFAGSGTVSDWIVVHSLFAALLEGLAADILLGTSRVAALTPDAIYDALAEVTLIDATTVAVDMSTFINAKVTLGGNRTLGNPTNAKPGQTGRIRVIQDGTGSRTLAFSSNWKRQGGAPTLTTTAAAYDVIVYDVIASNIILYDLIRNPS